MVTSYRIANGDVSAEVEVCRMGERSDTHLSDCDGFKEILGPVCFGSEIIVRGLIGERPSN
jgi:hypothetical protein